MKLKYFVLTLVSMLALSLQIVPISPSSAAIRPPLKEFLHLDDFDSYCKAHGYVGARLVENTAYGYKCMTKAGAQIATNTSAVCSENNKPTEHVIAWMPEDYYVNPEFAWRCVQLLYPSRVAGHPFGYQGALDLDKFCRDIGLTDGAVLRGKTVEDWSCRSGDYVTRIYMERACNEVYGGNWDNYSVPIFNYWDAYSVRCWK